MTGIIGSGFGLYGYMPALLQVDEKVFLLERTKEKFLQRKELLCYEHRILWAKDLDELLPYIDTLIISLPPQEQFKLLNIVLLYSNIKHLILEKPIAVSPLQSTNILLSIFNQGINFRINYTFLEAQWLKDVENVISLNKGNLLSVFIQWHFKAHHFRNQLITWKSNHEDGGGAIRFYGIHFIALATHLSFEKVSFSYANATEKNVSSWICKFEDSENNSLNIDIDSNTDVSVFSINIEANGKSIYNYKTRDPFDEVPGNNSGLDKRINGLSDLYLNLKSVNTSIELFNYYQATNHLWASVENILEVQ
ncbi:MAG: Gfo/Idh/MocA family oxidoreductase [Bacteroidia bacterium]